MEAKVISLTDKIKLNMECQSCIRLVEQNCKGKKGGSPCLAYKNKE